MTLTYFLAKVMIIVCAVMFIGWYLMHLYVKIKKSIPDSQVSDFATLLEILLAMINLELQLYETEIFSNREGITNSNFTNFYNDICNSVEQHISDDFMKKITVYVTEDFVYTLIARKVKAYLVDKVQ